MDRIYNIEYWNEIKGKLKKEYPILTKSDLHLRDGVDENFLGMIAYKIGITRKELREKISSL